MYTVYMHENKINHKKYIGITKQKLEKRWQKGYGYSTQPKFYRAILKYGWENFEHFIMCDGISLKEANECEKLLISQLNTIDYGYNVTYGGDGVSVKIPYMLGKHHSKETKEKLSKSHKGIALSKEHVIQMGKIAKELWKDESYRIKQLNIRKTKEYREHLSNSLKGKKSIAKSKAKMKKVCMYDLNMNYIKTFDSLKEASKEMKISINTISRSLHNKLKAKPKKYIWRFENDIKQV